MSKNGKVLSAKSSSYKVGKAVKAGKVIATSLNGTEVVGEVVYKRKAEYRKPSNIR
ncbi:hypothetical protein LG296_06785 [Ureibacillus chungkukjangi]|uniref:hypothetical protein n=1 Tax=Ureibacillus chungkukjangi TaxID=1202712 RepID=UPI0038502F59